jgi:hypothetical protein
MITNTQDYASSYQHEFYDFNIRRATYRCQYFVNTLPEDGAIFSKHAAC